MSAKTSWICDVASGQRDTVDNQCARLWRSRWQV